MDQAERLRKMISMQESDQPLARVITVTSGKGGVGKSSVSVNLAIELTKAGKRVVILDADFGLANIEVMLGIRPQYNIGDLIYKDKTIEEIVTKGPLGIGFISGGSGVQELVNLDSNQVNQLIQKLSKLDSIADVIIIDTGAGISNTVLEFVLFSSEILLVVTSEPTSITDAYALLKVLNRKKVFNEQEKTLSILANRVENINEGKELFQKLSVVADKFLNLKLNYLGCVPNDQLLQKAVLSQQPVTLAYPKALATEAFTSISEGILCQETAVQKDNVGITNVFLKLIRRRRK
mgnify:CR=1 FL=1